MEIPAHFAALKSADPALALAWRLAAREVLEAYLDRGYAVVDLLCGRDNGRQRCTYVLVRNGPASAHRRAHDL
jgi:predicted GNAT superfamily acetyltransferase